VGTFSGAWSNETSTKPTFGLCLTPPPATARTSSKAAWVIETRHQRRPWEVVVEPDSSATVLIVVTAYSVWE